MKQFLPTKCPWLLAIFLTLSALPTVAQTVFINEIHYDNAGTDVNEFIEVAGPAGTDLTGWQLVLYNGTTPTAAVVYNTRTLSGAIDDEGGGSGAVAFTYPVDGLQNGGNDGVALVNPGGTVVQLLSYEGQLTASNGPAAGQTSVNLPVSQQPAPSVGSSLHLTGSGNQYGNFTWATTADDSPGSINTGQTFSAPTSPLISVAPATLSGFSTPQGTPSAPQSYTASGTNLTADVVVTAPAGYEIKRQADASYVTSLTLTQSGGTVSATPIDVRLTATTAGAYNGVTITHTSAGATPQNVTLNGVVTGGSTGPCGTIISITAARAAASGTVVTISGRLSVSSQFFDGQNFYIQDENSGIEIFDNPARRGANFAIGDLVTITGTRSVFDGEAQLSPITCIERIGTTNEPPPAPVVTNAQLPTYEGRLVSLQNVTITNTAGQTFAGATNYTLSDGTVMRITTTTDLVGAGIPTGPVSVTGVVGQFNGTYQLLPRLLADVQGATPPVTGTCGGDGSATGTSSTFDVVTWNIEWFGFDQGTFCTSRNYADRGPVNETLQEQNVRAVIQQINADVYFFQEVSDPTRLQPILDGLGYDMTCLTQYYSYYFQEECDPSAEFPKALAQKLCFGYRRGVVAPVETRALQLPAATTGGGAWASGRVPYLLVADVTLNGQTRRVHMVNLHAKSGSSADDKTRRQDDATTLKQQLDGEFGAANLIIAGDFNDDLDQSISGGASPYSNFLNDNANYAEPTLALSQAGCSTTGGFPDAIDHLLISSEMAAAYVAGSAVSIRPGISNFSNTTSDHYPTMARFNLVDAPLPVNLTHFRGRPMGEKAALSWETVGEENSDYFDIQRSADAREFVRLGRVQAAGTTERRQVYGFLDENPLPGTNYYRLRQVDRDGAFTYSKVEAVTIDADAPTLDILGNPAEGRRIRVLLRNLPAESLTLMTLTGQIYGWQAERESDSVYVLKPVSILPPGVYLLQAQQEGIRIVRKVLVR